MHHAIVARMKSGIAPDTAFPDFIRATELSHQWAREQFADRCELR
jgi:hypothetical protein